MNTLEGFEDENPFEQDGDHINSETSSTSQVALYEPPSPPHPSRQLSPTSPNMNRPPFPSPGSHRQPTSNFKTDFCCTRDRVLHNGDDIEILVSSNLLSDFYISPESSSVHRLWMLRKPHLTQIPHTLHTSSGQEYVLTCRLFLLTLNPFVPERRGAT